MSAEDRNGKVSTDEGCTPRERSFDELTKGLASATVSRRGALRLLAGVLVGGTLASVPGVGRIAGNSGEAQAQTACGGAGEGCTATTQGQGTCCQGNTCINSLCCPNLRTCAGGCCAAGASCSGRACACTTAGQTACPSDTDPFGACTDLQTDENNCGRCGVKCASDQECLAGVCTCTTATCAGGCCSARANGTCKPGNTTEACGAGGAVCEACTTTVKNASPTCSSGSCGFECLAAFPTVCGSGSSQECVNLQTDENNCGQCGNACAGDQECLAGVCTCTTATCPNGCCSDRAGGTCRQGNTPEACGTGGVICVACPTVANASPTCSSGTCGFTCNTGFELVDEACLAVCGPNQTRCSGTCVDDLQTNPAHCGSCGNACSTGQSCVSGACVTNCPPGQTRCNGTCVDLTASPTNCGSCGNACAAGQSCVSGACCTTAQVCGSVCCPAGQSCVNGTCQTPVTPCGTNQTRCTSGNNKDQCKAAAGQPCTSNGNECCGQCRRPSPGSGNCRSTDTGCTCA